MLFDVDQREVRPIEAGELVPLENVTELIEARLFVTRPISLAVQVEKCVRSVCLDVYRLGNRDVVTRSEQFQRKIEFVIESKDLMSRLWNSSSSLPQPQMLFDIPSMSSQTSFDT